eukprot:6237988-Alexandrium_andersonii.AAC.1
MLDSEASCTEHGELPFSPSSSGGRQSKNSDAGSLQLKPGSPSSEQTPCRSGVQRLSLIHI